MATKEPDRPNPNPELKMTPSQTKLMEQCRVEAEYQFEEQTGFIAHSRSVTPQFWIGGYAQALFDERSKRPTVEQVMEVVDDELWTARDRLDDGGSPTNEMMCALGAISSRLTKLLDEK